MAKRTSKPAARPALSGSFSMNQAVQDAINRQITNEFSASFSYLAMSTVCERLNFTGSARWLRIQSQEEYAHAMRLVDFLLARGYRVRIDAIPAPRAEFGSLPEIFEAAYAQEREVSRQIDGLYELAFAEKAFAALVELQWFLTEQVEEEKVARETVAKLNMVKDDPASLLDLDRELGSRAPAAADGAEA
ncbi:MAG: ferritin [Vicinamibacterales bacterium]